MPASKQFALDDSVSNSHLKLGSKSLVALVEPAGNARL